ncbi:MAG: ferredoxin [Magnetococcales bacterium]|nr:ferredoxin [Magnetococcales bacterium]MBF0323416.1 ferredoxin [Magnetococcales bacterium]
MDPHQLQESLTPHGLCLRGWFSPHPGEILLTGEERQPATVVLVGNTGGSAWNPFSASPEAKSPQHPFDTWTRRVLEQIATKFACGVCFPFTGPPFLPFPSWARRAESVYDSPLGILVHPHFGLWHAYRGALLFAEAWEPLRGSFDRPHPCPGCHGRPCLRACPVQAFTGSAYQVEPCRQHLTTETGRFCLSMGCLARHACPVGLDAVYPPAQIQFHMRAFLDSLSG